MGQHLRYDVIIQGIYIYIAGDQFNVEEIDVLAEKRKRMLKMLLKMLLGLSLLSGL